MYVISAKNLKFTKLTVFVGTALSSESLRLWKMLGSRLSQSGISCIRPFHRYLTHSMTQFTIIIIRFSPFYQVFFLVYTCTFSIHTFTLLSKIQFLSAFLPRRHSFLRFSHPSSSAQLIYIESISLCAT